MALEQLANNPQDTLSAGVDGATNPVTVSVNDASEFPSTGNFRILIDSEILLVTAVSGNNFTATRAQEGTSIAAHLSAAAVTLVLTAGSIKQHTAEFHGYDTFANRPTAGQVNRLFIASDGNTLFRDTGSVWQSMGPVVGPFTTPDIADFPTQVNFLGSSSAANSKGTIEWFDTSAQGSANQVQCILDSVPVGNWTLTAAFSIRQGFFNDANIGLVLRNSTNGRLELYGLNQRNSENRTVICLYNYTNPTTFSSTVFQIFLAPPPVIMMRIRYDGTNLVYEISQDFVRWNYVGTETLAGSHVGAGLSQVGFFINAFGSTTSQTFGGIIYHLVLG